MKLRLHKLQVNTSSSHRVPARRNPYLELLAIVLYGAVVAAFLLQGVPWNPNTGSRDLDLAAKIGELVEQRVKQEVQKWEEELNERIEQRVGEYCVTLTENESTNFPGLRLEQEQEKEKEKEDTSTPEEQIMDEPSGGRLQELHKIISIPFEGKEGLDLRRITYPAKMRAWLVVEARKTGEVIGLGGEKEERM